MKGGKYGIGNGLAAASALAGGLLPEVSHIATALYTGDLAAAWQIYDAMKQAMPPGVRVATAVGAGAVGKILGDIVDPGYSRTPEDPSYTYSSNSSVEYRKKAPTRGPRINGGNGQ